jgi:hypothetical protein
MSTVRVRRSVSLNLSEWGQMHIELKMNWTLIFRLSLFGLAMGFGTVFFISSGIEPFLWLAIFFVSAYLIARQCAHRRFLHGLIVGVANSVWITATHSVFLTYYLSGHAHEAAMMKSMPLPGWPRLMMMVTGPVVGIMSGIIIGALAVVIGHFVKHAVSKAPESAL